MCDKCDEMWATYKKKEMEYTLAKQAYLDQSKRKCADKEPEAEPEKQASKEESILREHDFLESQGKPGLYFKKTDEDTVIFIDMRKGSPRAYGFQNNESMDHEEVRKETKAAVNAIRMLTAKDAGQTSLDAVGDEE